MSDWERRLQTVLETLDQRERSEVINEVANLAFEVSEAQGDAYLDTHAPWAAYRSATARLYYEHIVSMETEEVARLLAVDDPSKRRYMDMASEKGQVSYLRVADMFDHVDFTNCQQFVLVGCGQLPVTAIHVMDRTDVPEIVVLDVSRQAIEAVERLKHKFGWNALHPQLCNGRDFDFSRASVVYVGNMVTPKLDTMKQILDTTADGVQIVVREPYSLGRLWTEKVESLLARQMEVLGRGAVSRHLSRDLFVRKRNGAS